MSTTLCTSSHRNKKHITFVLHSIQMNPCETRFGFVWLAKRWGASMVMAIGNHFYVKTYNYVGLLYKEKLQKKCLLIYNGVLSEEWTNFLMGLILELLHYLLKHLSLNNRIFEFLQKYFVFSHCGKLQLMLFKY